MRTKATEQVVQMKQLEQMDPDFGRWVKSGEGFGSIPAEKYSQLVSDLEQMDPDFGRQFKSGEGFGSIPAEKYDQLVSDLQNDASKN